MNNLNERVHLAEQQWRDASPQELIEHIYTRFHQRHREQLPELKHLAMRVEEAHSDHENVPTGLAIHLDNMLQELESHMMKEEQILFPMLSQGIYPSGPISVMEEEHQQHENEINKINELTNNLNLPEGVCGTWRLLYSGLKELQDDLHEHIHLENNVLFVERKTETPAHGKDFCCGSCQ
ncbi:hemerythrin domain-containing protein [Pseudoalteromonas sp. KG3]|uniref:hemerythrin domain-containing protein n=1 Tax=Pseudoalteromonas TaxID=53246 RepID=UPI0024BC8821|nr:MULTISPECIES: hemerythrin domain-containing protein [Pseudoalteromonas]WKD25534.1 hemerythrin domain-containing protein [Pseudoalteromonas sp. KG3]